jgi:hypothetical protein
MSYFIKNIKYDISGGLFNSIVVTSLEYEKNNESKFLSVVDIEGMFEFHLSDEDIFEILLEDTENEKVEKTYIDSFNGIDLSELQELTDKFDDDSMLIKYIIMVLRLEVDEADDLIKKTKNKYLTKEIISKYDYEDLL